MDQLIWGNLVTPPGQPTQTYVPGQSRAQVLNLVMVVLQKWARFSPARFLRLKGLWFVHLLQARRIFVYLLVLEELGPGNHLDVFGLFPILEQLKGLCPAD